MLQHYFTTFWIEWVSITSGEIGFNKDDILPDMSEVRLMLQMEDFWYERSSDEQLQLLH